MVIPYIVACYVNSRQISRHYEVSSACVMTELGPVTHEFPVLKQNGRRPCQAWP